MKAISEILWKSVLLVNHVTVVVIHAIKPLDSVWSAKELLKAGIANNAKKDIMGRLQRKIVLVSY